MSLQYFPFFPGDYLRDTMGLSACEHGCYLLLLMHSWTRGPLRDDLDYLQRITGNPPMETIRFILENYWERLDIGWINKRLEDIKQKQIEAYERRANAGRKGGLVKSSNAKAMLKQCVSNQNQNQIKENPLSSREVKRKAASRFSPPTVDEVRDYILEKNYRVDAERFVSFYESKGWMVGRNPMKSWKAAVAGWESRSEPSAKQSAASRFMENLKNA